MKNLTLAIIILIGTIPWCNAQPLFKAVTFPNLHGQTGYSRITTSRDSNFVIFGEVGVPALTKIYSNGNPPQCFTNVGIGVPWEIKPCSDNGYFIFSFLPGRLIVKTDSLFQVQWEKNSSYKISFEDVFESQGNYYAVGTSRLDSISNFNYGTITVALLKFNSTGNLIAHQIVADTTPALNNRYTFDYVKGITVGINGDVYLCFQARDVQAAGTCNWYPLVLKFDASLNLVWGNGYSTSLFGNKTDLIALHDGSILFAGDYYSNNQFCRDSRIFLKKIDPTGTVIFAKVFYHSFRSDENYHSVIEAADHSFIVSGSYYDSLKQKYNDYFFRTDSMGNLINCNLIDIPADQNGVDHQLMLSAPIQNRIPATIGYYSHHQDSLYFIETDTSLLAPCRNIPCQLLDSAVSLNSGSWLYHLALLNYNYQVTSTIVASQSQQVALTDVCPPVNTSDSNIDPGIYLYPNPMNSQLTIRSSSKIDELEIINAMGQDVLRFVQLEQSSTLNFKLNNGIYFVITIVDGKRRIHKLVVNSGH